MPSITDWLMVVITFVYVVATFLICLANYRSANASKAQFEEMKRQYEDTKRINILPYIVLDSHGGEWRDKIELCVAQNGKMNFCCVAHLEIRNIGNGTAKDFSYVWNNEDGSYDRGKFPISALRSGDSYFICIEFCNTRDDLKTSICSIDLYYKDMMENQYKQKIIFEFQRNVSQMKLKNMSMVSPKYIKES